MKKNTKQILLSAVGVWCIFCIIMAIIQWNQETTTNEVVQEQTAAEQVTKDIEGDSILLVRCKSLYEELIGFKDKYSFKQDGFSVDGAYAKWMESVRNFTNDESKRLMIAYGIVPGDLEMLGLEYAMSKGKETDFTKEKRKELDELFANPVRQDN